MNIREGGASNSYLSAETYLQFQVLSNGKRYYFDEPVLFATLGDNHLKRSYLIGNQELNVDVLDFMPNPQEGLVEDPNGVPIIKVVIGGMNGREEFLVKYLDKVSDSDIVSLNIPNGIPLVYELDAALAPIRHYYLGDAAAAQAAANAVAAQGRA